MRLDRVRLANRKTMHGPVREVLRALRPSKARIQDAEDCAQRLIAHLDRISDRFTIKRSVGHGSVHRNTVLKQFRDIDYLLLLDADALTTSAGQRPTPGYAIGWLRDGLGRCRAGVAAVGNLPIRDQRHSVGVEYRGRSRGFRVDLVPALVTHGNGPYLIPSRTRQRWIETRPRRLARRIDGAPSTVVDAIRLVKGWKRARGKRKGFSLPSYGIEVLLTERTDLHVHSKPLDIVRHVFEEWADAHAGRRLTLLGGTTRDAVTLSDPTSGENLMAGNDGHGRRRFIEAARRGLRDLDDAEAALGAGHAGKVGQLLERLFLGNP